MNATRAAQGAAGAAAPEMVRRLVQGSVLHLSAQLFLTLCTYVVAVVLARSLGPAAFGTYGIVYSLLMTTESVGRFGIPQASGKLMAELPAQHDRIAASGLTISLSAYLVLFAGMWLAAPAIAAIFGIPEGAGLLRLAFWDIPIYGAFFVLWHILNARRRFLIESTSFVLYALTKVVGISILVWIGPTLRDAFIVNIASSLVAALFIGWFVGRMPWRFSLAESRRIMQLAMPIGILTVGLQLLPTIDLWMLSAIGNYPDDAVRGYYVAALSIARIPNFISNGLNAVLVTSIASAMGAGDRVAVQRVMELTVRFLLVALLPAGALIAVNARDILTLLFSPEFAPAAPLLAVLGFAQGVCMTSFGTMLSIMTGGRQAKTASRLAMALVPIVILFSLVGVSLFGALGAAVASLLSCATAVVGAGMLLWREYGSFARAGTVLRIVLATLAAAVVSAHIEAEGVWLLVELVLIGLVYLAALPVLGIVGRSDLDVLRGGKAAGAGGQVAAEAGDG